MKIHPKVLEGFTIRGIGRVELWEVTPEVAKGLLAINTRNRNSNPALVSRYASDMRSKNWKFTGDPIRIGRDGVLQDGQNRCLAIIESNTTHKVIVITNLDPEAQEFMDHGWKRTMAHVLGMRGESFTNTLAPLLQRIAVFSAGGDMDMRDARLVTEREALAYLDGPEGDLIRRAVEHGDRIQAHTRYRGSDGKTHGLISGAVAAFAYWRCAQVDPDAATDFFHRFERGVRYDGDPLLALDKGLKNLQPQKRLGDTKKHQLALVFIAWNHFRNNRQVQILRWSPSSSKFPVPK